MESDMPFDKIVMLPSISGNGYKEIALSPYESDIISIIGDKRICQKDILETVTKRKDDYGTDIANKIKNTYRQKIRNLIFNEILL